MSNSWVTLRFVWTSNFGSGYQDIVNSTNGNEAVLYLEMLSDVEITSYEEPPPTPECVKLTKEMKSRHRSLIATPHRHVTHKYHTMP